MPYGNALEVENLARKFKEESFINQRSILNGRHIWTTQNFEELHRAYNQRLDEGTGSFENKLGVQLHDVSSDARQLFAELYILDMLPLGNIGLTRKVQNINFVLEGCNPPVSLTDEVTETLQAGVFNGGQGYNNYRWGHFVFAIEFGLAFFALPKEQRIQRLTAPEEVEETFYGLVKATEAKGKEGFQKALCYLFAPNDFESIISDHHLKRITQHFEEYIEGEEHRLSLQRQASIIRKRVADIRRAPDWNFYLDRDEWMGIPDPEEENTVKTEAKNEAEDDATSVPLVFDSAITEDLLVSDKWVEKFLKVLSQRHQVILQGPPGTGKTYLARRMALNLAGSEDRVKLVQFHPAYTYEDFFEGFRPVLDKSTGNTSLQLRQGPLRQLAEEASENSDQNYFLIIDEINRGNLARIFGELYFLLEYREHSVDLMYSQDRFSLPANLYIIGTMNTADRSIALVDSAMRRRFAFFNLHPDEEPTSTLLQKWAVRNNKKNVDAVKAWTNLNESISDRDLKVGPSYFMRHEAFTEEGLSEIWESEIIPLLEEYFYADRATVKDKYALSKLRDSDVTGN